MSVELNEEQRRAAEAEGFVFVTAGAGTGKTRVLVERFANALAAGVPSDRILVITFTERAAAELQARLRARFSEGDLPSDVLRGSWISTIHGFCRRVLQRHALAAGLDPGFRVLDEGEAVLLQSDAYDEAFDAISAGRDDILDVAVAYGALRLRSLIFELRDRLRSSGGRLRVDPIPGLDIASCVADVEALARAIVGSETTDLARRQAEDCLDFIGRSGRDPMVLCEVEDFRVRTRAGEGYNAALDALASAARDQILNDMRGAIEALLVRFDESIDDRLHAAGGLDFDALQLRTLALLRSRDDIRKEYQERFAHIMVDEFQDTNRLQSELIDLLAGAESQVFVVGDERQSIYRFRDADVEVYRDRLSAAAADVHAVVVPLRRNYRSHPGILAAVNHVFGDIFGGGYIPLDPGEPLPDLAPSEPVVELVVVDAADHGAADARQIEARAIADRVAELVAQGETTPGDVVLLLASGTDADIYAGALLDARLPVLVATGRRYYETEAVRDLLAYLSILRNPHDDNALLRVLASPLVGVSNDALAVLARAAERRTKWTAIRDAPYPAADGTAVRAFLQRYDRLCQRVYRTPLSSLIEEIVARHDFDLALLRHDQAPRLMANVRKLVRLARAWQDSAGYDLEGFVQSIDVRRIAGGREGEGASADEVTGAVRLLTIHAAKGLEFPVVVVPDGGRRTNVGRESTLVALPDGRAGLKVPDSRGRLQRTSVFDEVSLIDHEAEAQERDRLSYVALTRARDRLIVSGSTRPRDVADGESPFQKILQSLHVDLSHGERTHAIPGGTVSVRVIGDGAVEDPVREEIEGQISLFDHVGAIGIADAPTDDPLPEWPVELRLEAPPRPGRLSFTALSTYERCPYRFYVERILGVPRRESSGTAPDGGLGGMGIGSAVHIALEHGAVDRDGIAMHARSVAPSGIVSDDDLDLVVRLVESWRGSSLARSLEGAVGVAEQSFILDVDGAVLVGKLDLVARLDGEIHIVDYKTNRLGDRSPVEIRDDSYSLQETVYGLALLRAGHEAVTVHFAFLDGEDVALSRRWTTADLDRLAETVRAAIASVLSPPYPARPGWVCNDCPALGTLCAGPGLESLGDTHFG